MTFDQWMHEISKDGTVRKVERPMAVAKFYDYGDEEFEEEEPQRPRSPKTYK